MCARSSRGQSFGPIPIDPRLTPQGPAGVSPSVGEAPPTPASPRFPRTPWGARPSSFLALSLCPSVSTGESGEAQDNCGPMRAMLEEMGPPPQPLLPGAPTLVVSPLAHAHSPKFASRLHLALTIRPQAKAMTRAAKGQSHVPVCPRCKYKMWIKSFQSRESEPHPPESAPGSPPSACRSWKWPRGLPAPRNPRFSPSLR